jgi:hypothetical protein
MIYRPIDGPISPSIPEPDEKYQKQRGERQSFEKLAGHSTLNFEMP